MKKEGLWRANCMVYGTYEGHLLRNIEVDENGCLTATLIGNYTSINSSDDELIEVKERPEICIINTPIQLVEITDLIVLLNYDRDNGFSEDVPEDLPEALSADLIV